jgi:hypothetical protein
MSVNDDHSQEYQKRIADYHASVQKERASVRAVAHNPDANPVDQQAARHELAAHYEV